MKMEIKQKRQAAGFTLLELMAVIAILGILAAMAAPSYRAMIERQKIRSALNEWQNSFYLAQREAMRLKEPVILCGSADGVSCSNPGNNFNNGWIVVTTNGRILEDNGFSDPQLDLRVAGHAFVNGVRFAGNGRTNAAFATFTVRIAGTQDNDPRVRTLTINSGGRLIGVRR